jgi:hypothetical protein
LDPAPSREIAASGRDILVSSCPHADDAPTASVQGAADDVGQMYGLWIRRSTPPASAAQ